MKKNIFFLLFTIVTLNIFAQENIQPKWGISYCYGRVVNRPSTFSAAIYRPLENKWSYSAIEIFRVFQINKFIIHTGLAFQSNFWYYYSIPKYPYQEKMISKTGRKSPLLYAQLAYTLHLYKNISASLGIGGESRITGFNTLLADCSININPIYDLPLQISIKGRFARTFYGNKLGIYPSFPYLDNAALGFSVQYSFKPSKNKKTQE